MEKGGIRLARLYLSTYSRDRESPLPEAAEIEVTDGMVYAGQQELERQGVALDDSSPPIYLKQVFQAMLNARQPQIYPLG